MAGVRVKWRGPGTSALCEILLRMERSVSEGLRPRCNSARRLPLVSTTRRRDPSVTSRPVTASSCAVTA
eukprot:3828799-Rhodomonas_salina.1